MKKLLVPCSLIAIVLAASGCIEPDPASSEDLDDSESEIVVGGPARRLQSIANGLSLGEVVLYVGTLRNGRVQWDGPKGLGIACVGPFSLPPIHVNRLATTCLSRVFSINPNAHIVSGSGKCLAFSGGSPALSDCVSTHVGQQWNVISLGGSSYMLQNRKSGTCLVPINGGASTALSPCDGSNPTRWVDG